MQLLVSVLCEQDTVKSFMTRTQFTKESRQLLQVEYRFYRSCREDGALSESVEYYYNTFMPQIDVLASNVPQNKEASLGSMLNDVYGTKGGDLTCIKHSQMRLIHPFGAKFVEKDGVIT